eukprot:gnl/TRDRNA2_/TRDRNA2_33833_c0_seq1.p1 gnl/TRDRNA2_/TRDRNA2_33833_c0~~gnl/TRDRNA2_/TRDRNA2_33833_c0_seq1.p1  ORF type:complete len:314 (-),score=80.16 gnl/TRDRNA2_/TRDRNA2_33833_c0_seq1:81-986(-)
MASGNPFGLSEINHFGSFQRVGGKAGGFINKKFFHPSSLRNQEKLWKAITADEQEQRRQKENEKRREEERQVEELRKQIYLAGQGQAGDTAMFKASSSKEGRQDLLPPEKKEEREALQEQNRRRAQLKRDRLARDREHEDPQEDAATTSVAQPTEEERTLTKSKYRENYRPNGHESVWGSWYAVSEKLWGFVCCKVLNKDARCPLAAPLPDDPKLAGVSSRDLDEPRSKRARGRKNKREAAAAALNAAAAEAEAVIPDGAAAAVTPCGAVNATAATASGKVDEDGEAARTAAADAIELPPE